MEKKITVKKETIVVPNNEYVISKDGIRMTYEEWRQMIEAERD